MFKLARINLLLAIRLGQVGGGERNMEVLLFRENRKQVIIPIQIPKASVVNITIMYAAIRRTWCDDESNNEIPWIWEKVRTNEVGYYHENLKNNDSEEKKKTGADNHCVFSDSKNDNETWCNRERFQNALEWPNKQFFKSTTQTHVKFCCRCTLSWGKTRWCWTFNKIHKVRHPSPTKASTIVGQYVLVVNPCSPLIDNAVDFSNRFGKGLRLYYVSLNFPVLIHYDHILWKILNQAF